MSCHYQYVYNELKERNLWGIFYIPTLPYLNHKLLDVHRVHILLASNDANKILKSLEKRISPNFLIDRFRKDFQEQTYTKQKSQKAEIQVKKILNYYIDYQYREKILDELIQEFDVLHLCNCDEFYLTHSQIKEMNENQMLIGSHSVHHPVMSKLSLANQKKEIVDSFGFLEQNFNLKLKTFCFPYGGKYSYTDETLAILNQEKVLFSFDVNSQDIMLNDLKNNIQKLPRYDCNEFPYGQVRK